MICSSTTLTYFVSVKACSYLNVPPKYTSLELASKFLNLDIERTFSNDKTPIRIHLPPTNPMCNEPVQFIAVGKVIKKNLDFIAFDSTRNKVFHALLSPENRTMYLWGTKNGTIFPEDGKIEFPTHIDRGEEYLVSIVCTSEGWRVTINGLQFYEFLPLSTPPTMIEIKGKSEVYFTGLVDES